jgi:hypothetical protein
MGHILLVGITYSMWVHYLKKKEREKAGDFGGKSIFLLAVLLPE